MTETEARFFTMQLSTGKTGPSCARCWMPRRGEGSEWNHDTIQCLCTGAELIEWLDRTTAT